MSGVLHVIDATTRPDCLRQLRLLLGAKDMVASIGPPPECPKGTDALPAKVLHCPLGLARLGGLALREMAVKASLVHAWSAFSASAGAVAAGRRKLPLLLSLPCLPDKRAIRDLRIESAGGGLGLIVPTDHARGVLLSAGLDPSAVHVLRPAAEPLDRRDARRREARAALGLADGDFALVAPGHMTRGAGHKQAAWAHAIVMHLRSDFRLIFPGGGPYLPQVRQVAQTNGFAEAVVFTHDEMAMADALAAADAPVLLCEGDCGVGNLAAALASAAPVLASRTPDIVECTDGGNAAMLVEPRDPPRASAAMLRLLEEPRLGADLARRGQEFARATFDRRAVRRRLDEIYITTRARGLQPAGTQGL